MIVVVDHWSIKQVSFGQIYMVGLTIVVTRVLNDVKVDLIFPCLRIIFRRAQEII